MTNLLIIVKTAEIISFYSGLKIEKYLELKHLHIVLQHKKVRFTQNTTLKYRQILEQKAWKMDRRDISFFQKQMQNIASIRWDFEIWYKKKIKKIPIQIDFLKSSLLLSAGLQTQQYASMNKIFLHQKLFNASNWKVVSDHRQFFDYLWDQLSFIYDCCLQGHISSLSPICFTIFWDYTNPHDKSYFHKITFTTFTFTIHFLSTSFFLKVFKNVVTYDWWFWIQRSQWILLKTFG